MLNKHILEAIQNTVDVDRGNVVIVHQNPRTVLKDLAENLTGVKSICRTNGQEEIVIDNGAWIRIIRTSGSGRGLTANLLVLPIRTSLEVLEVVVPIVMGTKGDILGYL